MAFFGIDVTDFTISQVKALFRKHDESNLFPICGRFNVTERAIRRLNRAIKSGLTFECGYDYALALDEEITNIVNAEV